MSGHADKLIAERLDEALVTGPLDVVGMAEILRKNVPDLFVGVEGGLHVLLHGLVRKGRVVVHGYTERGLPRYERPEAGRERPRFDPAAPTPAPPEDARLAAQVASAVRGAADRGRITSDVIGHLAALRDVQRSTGFGSARSVRHHLKRTDRGRPTVAFAAGAGGGLWRFVVHEGPWILTAALAFVLIRTFVAEVYVIPSKSMVPTLLVDDRVIGVKPGGRKMPERWQIVIYERNGTAYVKRVAGRGGEAIELFGGDVYIDGRVAVKPDDVRRALRFPFQHWEFGGARPDGWTREEIPGGGAHWTYDGHELWSESPAHSVQRGGDVRLQDVYLVLDVERGVEDEIALELVRGETVFSVEAGPRGMRVLRRDGEDEGVLATAEAPPPGALQLEISHVDGVLRASGGDLRHEGEAQAPLAPARPGIRLQGFGTRLGRLSLDKDIHHTPEGEYGVAPSDRRGAPGEYAFRVPEDAFFALGDNTYDSRDSRTRATGPISVDELVGPVRFRIWPPSRIGSVR